MCPLTLLSIPRESSPPGRYDAASLPSTSAPNFGDVRALAYYLGADGQFWQQDSLRAVPRKKAREYYGKYGYIHFHESRSCIV